MVDIGDAVDGGWLTRSHLGFVRKFPDIPYNIFLAILLYIKLRYTATREKRKILLSGSLVFWIDT